jgi:hypothetical protein
MKPVPDFYDKTEIGNPSESLVGRVLLLTPENRENT